MEKDKNISSDVSLFEQILTTFKRINEELEEHYHSGDCGNYDIRKEKFYQQYNSVMKEVEKRLSTEVITFETPEDCGKTDKCRRKAIIYQAKQINTKFQVKDRSGTYIQGNPGDYIIIYVNNELGIYDKDAFESDYEFI